MKTEYTTRFFHISHASYQISVFNAYHLAALFYNHNVNVCEVTFCLLQIVMCMLTKLPWNSCLTFNVSVCVTCCCKGKKIKK